MNGGLFNRFVAIASCVAILVVTTGIPLPTKLVSSNEEFPCKNHGCGCLNAEMCRTNCCCVKPVSAKKTSCCSMPPTKKGQKQDPKDGSKARGLVIGALQCKGVSVLLAFGISLVPPTPRVALQEPITIVAQLRNVTDDFPELLELQPPVPPPRFPA